jgi:hypothetical protein
MLTLPADRAVDSVSPFSSEHLSSRGRDGIIAFQSIPTDDGQAAIVVFVAHHYAAFKPILSNQSVLRKFERKNTREEDLVRELRKYKRNFRIEMLRVAGL